MFARRSVLIVVICVVQCFVPTATILAQSATTPISSPIYTIIAGGDVMLGRRVAKYIKLNNDVTHPWNYIAPTFQKADISFVNLEAVASSRGTALQKRYTFRFDPVYLHGMAYAGIDVVSQANNHALDYGYTALCDSYTNISSLGIDVIGTGCNRKQATTPVIKTLPDGTRVAFVAMSEFYQGNTATTTRPGFAPYSVVWITDLAQNLKDTGKADIVIVSVHAGIEHSFAPGERMQELYRSLVDGGVDVVLGHHPHVPQPIESHGEGWIVYSLGNLIFDMHDAIPHTKRQILARIVIQDGRVRMVRRVGVEMTDQFQPYLLKDKKEILNGTWGSPQ
jgi:poly-gamma-glutamate capsule biosynthesis protein CapA/YwtB (metallophosphatase superfamily)